MKGLTLDVQSRVDGCPAAGLDARAAAIVMRSVRNIVSTGRTIVCERPQPATR